MTNRSSSISIWFFNFLHSERVVSVLIFLFLLGGLGLKVFFILSYAPIRGEESNVLFSIQELMVGDQLYPNPDEPPFSITQYTPLYYLLVAAVANFFGIVPGVGFEQIFIVGRALSVVLSIGIGVIVFLICREYGAGNYMSALGAVSAFLLPIPWYSLLRPDALMGFLGILTIVLYSYYLLKQETKNNIAILALIGAIGFLAFLTKQNGAIFLIAVILYGLIKSRIRDAAYISLGFIFTLLITSILFLPYYEVFPSETNFIYEHIIGGLQNGVDPVAAYRKLYSIFFSWYFPLFALPIAGILLMVRNRTAEGDRKIDEVTYFLAISYFIVTTANLIAGLKNGSAINYINESLIIGIIFIIRLFSTNKTFSELEINSDHKIVVYSLIFLYLFINLTHQTISYRDEIRDSHILKEAGISSRKDSIDYLENELSSHPDVLIYSEDTFVNNYFFENIIVPQQEVAILNWMLDVRDYSEISALMDTGALRYIVVRENYKLPKNIMGTEITGFELVQLTEDIRVYQNTRSP